MQRVNNLLYAFVVLKDSSAPINDIKFILNDKRIRTQSGEITLYTPYKELISSYKSKFYGSEMWGIGFSLEALQNKAKGIDCRQLSSLQDGDLICCKIQTSILDFTSFDLQKGEAFFLAPSGKFSEHIWFNGFKTAPESKEQYKQWWCKGLRNDLCSWRSDGEIAKYLKGDYNRFCWKNYKEVDNNDLFPAKKLFGNPQDYYSLLNLTPQELHEVGGRIGGINLTLF